ncbi:MAG: O-antigen ligase family protein [Clostridia bacterium]|nr:O-antigen ligase family protein [Clostridia bacterium]
MPSSIKIDPFFGRGAHGTFLNTNSMGSFVSIVLPLFIIKYIFTNKKKYLIASIIAFNVLIMCIARSSWVAFAVISIIGIIYLIVKKNKDYWKRFLILLIGFIISFTAIYMQKGNNIVVSKINVVEVELKQAKENGISNYMGSGRIEIWKLTSKLLYKVPMLGTGIDALEYGLAHFETEEFLNYIIKHGAYIDRAHNEYLHIAVTMGIPAVIIYIAFISWILIPKLRQLFKDKKNATFSIVIISYLVQAFFNFSTIGVAPIFWFVLGLSENKTFYKIDKD